MSESERTIEEEINDISMGRPHVVILGAGASRAAFPEGDKNGTVIPLNNDLIKLVDLEKDLKKHGLNVKNNNFEEVYSKIYESGKNPEFLETIESKVYDFFSSLELPDYPTIYDYLVLSLRPKDVIITFNWDPFLWMAARRNYKKVSLPHLIFLHGNVAVGYCHKCKQKGQKDFMCTKCGQRYNTSRLLYPIKRKDYNQDPGIWGEWKMLQKYLQYAYMLTIFGYSAPVSDVEAIELMKKAWQCPKIKQFEQIEIIHRPGKNVDDLFNTWKPFIFEGHYQNCDDFFSSWIATHPRRTCEAMWSQLMEAKFIEDNPVPRSVDFEKLWQWFWPLVVVEEKEKKK